MLERSSSHRPRALIVEDEALIALGPQAELETLGFDVRGLAANTNQAISCAINDRPDVVIMDILSQWGSRRHRGRAMAARDVWGADCVCDRLQR